MRWQCTFILRSNVDKLKLPDPTGSLPTKVPPSYTVLANAGVKSVLKSLLGSNRHLHKSTKISLSYSWEGFMQALP